MSKSDDNTNELESYGVWVKNSTGNSDNTETPADPSDELNLDDGGLDLPDFDDSDFSDMFKEEPQGADSGSLDDFGSEDDTTLSTDELANITDGFEVEQVDAPAESDDLDLGDFGTDTNDIPSESSEEAPAFETEEADITDDFASTENSTEDFTSESTGDEEISLDDFMDGGFSDESVAAGNNGYEPGAEPSAQAASSGETEELSLDDFMDGDSFDSAPDTPKESEPIEDEAPLDMDINFDDSADSVETEDNVSLDISSDDDIDYDTEETEEVETEEVSMDDFGSSFTAEETASPSPAASSENINTEDVDLSDFGIDANAEETPIVQDVEEAKNKEKIVDYDLSVGDESTATAPVVNEIKSDTVDEASDVTEAPAAPAAAPSENTTSVDNSLLQQIVSELSNLKDEMNKLKSNLEEMKTQENNVSPAAGLAAGAAGLAAGAAIAAAASSEADEIPEAKDEGGFFSGDDEDETIALSFDELDNIMNTAEFSDTVEEGTGEEESSEAVIEENTEESQPEVEIPAEPEIEETAVTEPVVEETVAAEPAAEETVADSVAVEEIVDEQDDTVIDESIIPSELEIDEESDDVDSEIENAISDETDTSLDDINLDDNETSDFDFSSDEKLEEPKIDEFIPDGNDELYENEELPDEISIPKEDDLLVESTSSDFMDSVKETSDDDTSSEFITEETDEIDTIDLPSELPDNIDASSEEAIEETPEETIVEEETVEEAVDEPVVEEETIEDDIPTVDKVLGDEPVIEENIEETVEENSVEAEDDSFSSVDSFSEASEEAPEETISSSASFAEVDNLDNTLSESNLAYLNKTEDENTSDNIANADLKQDIKSVLLYMDQLLENLPEEKIVEFAKSDEFVTYKKLFSELGLS